jgi:hypothetical protein
MRVADLCRHREVMRHEQHRSAEPLLHPDQVEDLPLDQVVEIGGRLVGDNEGRAQRDPPWRSGHAAACRR